jgi:hypothetical protein
MLARVSCEKHTCLHRFIHVQCAHTHILTYVQRAQVTTYEEAFRRIKEATGIEDINEVIEKFLTQDETAANLTQLTKEAQVNTCVCVCVCVCVCM